jgi:16S rRNA (adenine1518-N6/adenine1519-N6)-dimethyltransferase
MDIPQPLKKFGQNFLIDPEIVSWIVEQANLNQNETVLEIGPGTGVLTKALARQTGTIIAIEKDPRMAEFLKKDFAGLKNIKIINEDALRFAPELKKYKIVANLPFYITAPLIRKFLETTEAKPESMTLVVQKEVGERICARPPDMSILGVSVQFYAQAEFLGKIPKKAFWPEPEVDGALIKITPQAPAFNDNEKFFKIVKAGFAHPRKQLYNNLSSELKIDKATTAAWLKKNGLETNQRAETLRISDWINLTKSFVL